MLNMLTVEKEVPPFNLKSFIKKMFTIGFLYNMQVH